MATEKIPAGALAFTTLRGAWTVGDGDGEVLFGPYVDDVVVENPDPKLVRAAGSAHAAGVIEVTEGLDDGHVQSQEDGEAEYAKAQKDGRWLEGQEMQAAVEEDARERGEYGVEVDAAIAEDAKDG